MKKSMARSQKQEILCCESLEKPLEFGSLKERGLNMKNHTFNEYYPRKL